MQLKTERLSIRPFEVPRIKKISLKFMKMRKPVAFCFMSLGRIGIGIGMGILSENRNQRSLGQKCSLSLAVLADDKVIGDIAIWYTRI